MKISLLSLTAVVASMLAACSGSSTTPTTTVPALLTPATRLVLFTVTGSGQSSAAASATAPEPIELGVLPCTTTAATCTGSILQTDSTATVVFSAVDGNGAALPEPAPILNGLTSMVTSAQTGSTLTVTSATTAPSVTSFVAGYPNTGGTLGVNIYPTLGIQFTTGTEDAFASQGYSIVNKVPVATNAASGDLFVDAAGKLNVPAGAVFLPSSTSISSLSGTTTCAVAFSGTPFTSIALSAVAAAPAADAILLAKTASPGTCVKLRVTGISAAATNAYLVGLVGVSDPAGAFPNLSSRREP